MDIKVRSSMDVNFKISYYSSMSKGCTIQEQFRLPVHRTSDLSLAFVADKAIYAYANRLWCENPEIEEIYQEFVAERPTETRDALMRKAQVFARRFLECDGKLYERCTEPMYAIRVLPDKTVLEIVYTYDEDIALDHYFSALEFEAARSEAMSVAVRNGHMDSMNRINAMLPIKVYDESFVTK